MKVKNFFLKTMNVLGWMVMVAAGLGFLFMVVEIIREASHSDMHGLDVIGIPILGICGSGLVALGIGAIGFWLVEISKNPASAKRKCLRALFVLLTFAGLAAFGINFFSDWFVNWLPETWKGWDGWIIGIILLLITFFMAIVASMYESPVKNDHREPQNNGGKDNDSGSGGGLSLGEAIIIGEILS